MLCLIISTQDINTKRRLNFIYVSTNIFTLNNILSQGRAIQQGKNFTVLKTRKTHVEIKDNHINKQSN